MSGAGSLRAGSVRAGSRVRGRSRLRAAGRLASYVWLPLVVVVSWVVVSAGQTSFYVPKFADTVAGVAYFFTPVGLTEQVAPTLRNLLIGFALAVVIGVVAGFVLGRISVLREATAPALEFLRAIPPPALLPLAIVLLGIGTEMKIGLIAFGALWPTLLSTIDAARKEHPGLNDVARVYGIHPARRLLQMRLPAAAPMIVAGMRTSLLYAITLIILSEMVATSAGLGHSVLLAQRSFRVADMWAAIIMLGVLGFVLNALFALVERSVLRWHFSRHKERGGSWIA